MNYNKLKTYQKGFVPYALAAFFVGLNGGLSTVLGPAFMLDMQLPYSNTSWTALAQAVSTAACAPVLGKLGDVFGRKKTLLYGILIFTFGTAISALSSSLVMLLSARFIVGIGTAAIAPTILSYIVTEFPPETIGGGFSLYMLLSSAAVIFGPTLGGHILNAFGWRSLMWISAFIGVIFFFLCLLTLPKRREPRRSIPDFDTTGACFVILFFSLLLTIPAFGQSFGWHDRFLYLLLILAFASLIGLILTEQRAKNPILIGHFIFRKAFILPVILLFLTQGLMQANMTNTIVLVNYTQPGNTTISGYAISIMYLGMSLGSVLLGPLADRFEPRRILTYSLVLTGLSCGLMLLFSTATSLFLLAASLGLLGFGLGANAAIFLKITLFGLSPKLAGAGTGIYGLFRDLAAPFGVAVFVPLFTNRIVALSTDPAMPLAEAEAAVQSVHMLAWIEVFCIVSAIIIVQFLPKIHKKGVSHEIKR